MKYHNYTEALPLKKDKLHFTIINDQKNLLVEYVNKLNNHLQKHYYKIQRLMNTCLLNRMQKMIILKILLNIISNVVLFITINIEVIQNRISNNSY